VLAEGNQEALRRIAWYYLKLLTAQQNLEQLASETSENELRRQVQQLRADLADKGTSSTLRESKEATLRILEKRLENWTRREQSLAEIASDLTRIEAQIDLALENAGMADKTETISANMDLVSRLLDDSIYGDSGASIAEVEQSYEPGSQRTGQSQ
jgi:hypothetical protein